MTRWLVSSLLAAVVGTGWAADTNGLAALRWQYRVIAVFAPTAEHGDQAYDTLQSSRGLDKRDIAWFVVGPDRIRTNLDRAICRDALEAVHGNGYEAVLIGKDGQVKNRQATLDLPRLFEAIDAMPMRQQEMRNR
ncbi:DUF4174 domain-containing protein [Salinisphaera sp. SPP-AMP-43]|uniref:DUF4174 domain-containing protein n=1 Tax=Salinisphaera sp. SPP-AMP-43 TaxID=3121288 RepID=UPI003C6DDFA4